MMANKNDLARHKCLLKAERLLDAPGIAERKKQKVRILSRGLLQRLMLKGVSESQSGQEGGGLKEVDIGVLFGGAADPVYSEIFPAKGVFVADYGK